MPFLLSSAIGILGDLVSLSHTCLSQAKRGQQVGGIAVARIFHGLSTPAFPVQEWAKCGFWGQFTAWDFSSIAQVARIELAKAARQQAIDSA